MRDPYSIYAGRILKLRPLEPIDAAPDQSDYGTIIHATLDRFVNLHPSGDLPGNAFDMLIELGHDAFEPLAAWPGVYAFWWPRFERIAHWFVDHEGRRRAILVQAHTELTGTMSLPGPAGPFLLTARADRIDRLTDGGLEIIDYKTGAIPREKEVGAGFSPQLPLEAAITADGGFDGVPAGRVHALSYWQVSGGRQPGFARSLDTDPATLSDQAIDGLKRLIAEFDDPSTAYLSRPRPDYAPRYSDFEHLARTREWGGTGEDGNDGQ
jgi:ATP-dependent helicase/nuclease subunit B